MPSFFPRHDMTRAKQAAHTAQRLRERFGLLGSLEQVERLAAAAKEAPVLFGYREAGCYRSSKYTPEATTRWVLVRFGKHDVACLYDTVTLMVRTVARPTEQALNIAKGA